MDQTYQQTTSIFDLILSYNYQQWANVFRSTQDPTIQFYYMNEMKENVEKIKADKSFVQIIIFDLFVNYLRSDPVFENEYIHKIRYSMLEVIEQISPMEGLDEAKALELSYLLIDLLNKDNEENATVCLRIFTDLHKSFQKPIESVVPRFLDFAVNLFRRFEEITRQAFAIDPPLKPQMIPANMSFKIVTECPIITAQLFRSFPDKQAEYVSKLFPLCIATVNIKPPIHAQNNRSLYNDFIGAQVKAVSFLAHILKIYPKSKDRAKDIMRGVISLIKNCPYNAESTRKELLVATRHFIGNFKEGFTEFIDDLIDENTLIGSQSISKHESIRQLAYSEVADLVYHARQELNPSQISKVIHLFCKNIHDPTLSIPTQTLSVRLLLNLVEGANRDSTAATLPVLLVRILETIVKKFACVQEKIKKIKEKIASLKESKSNNMDIDESNKTIPSDDEQEPSISETIEEYRVLVKAMAVGVRNIIYVAYQPQRPGPLIQMENYMHEVETLTKLFRNSLKCLTIYSNEFDVDDKLNQIQYSHEKKEVIVDHIAVAFTSIDINLFVDIISSQIGFLYQCIVDHSLLLYIIPQKFLAVKGRSRVFAEILLNFLIEKIPRLNEKKEGDIIITLFKTVFSAIGSSREDAEYILRPHLTTIISQAVKYAEESKNAANYYILIKYLLRGISQTDLFAKELLPVFPGLLDTFNKLLESSNPQNVKDIFVDISLNIPTPLSLQLPCLKQLMKPILISAESEHELHSSYSTNKLGIKVLELLIDKLSPEFLEPIMEDIKPKLMKALWRHLKLPPYQIAPQVLRIFGKMSGRNRNLLTPPLLEIKEFPEGDIHVMLPFKDDILLRFPLKDALVSAQKMLHVHNQASTSPISTFRRTQVYNLFKACASLLLSFNGSADQVNLEALNINSRESSLSLSTVGNEINIYEERNYPQFVSFENEDNEMIIKTRKEFLGDIKLVKFILKTVMICKTIDKIESDANEFFEKLCTHFSLLLISGVQSSIDKLNEIDPNIFIEVIVDIITLENRSYAQCAVDAIDILIKTADLFGDDVKSKLYVFDDLVNLLCQACYRKEWYYKAGGTLGLSHLANSKVPLETKHLNEYVRSLLYVIQDLPAAIDFETQELASKTLLTIIKMYYSRPIVVENESDIYKSFIVKHLASHLTSSNAVVRKNIQTCLETIAELNGCEVTELLEPHKDLILEPIYSNPLQKVSAKIQVGYFDAITFCLNLRPPLLTFDEKLVKLLSDIVDSTSPDDGRIKQSMTIKIASFEVMAAALGCTDFEKSEFDALRSKMITILMRSVVSRNKQTVQAAEKGLPQKVTNKAVQEAILMNLKYIPSILFDANARLHESLFEGLSILLSLYNKYYARFFKNTLGDKLKTFLKMYCMQESTQNKFPLKTIEDVRIVTSIIDVFHLLPSSEIYLEELVTLTLQLERQLPSLGHYRRMYKEISPFRQPLAKYMNVHHTQALNFFLPKLLDNVFSRLFISILQQDTASELREELSRNTKLLIESTFKYNKTMLNELEFKELRVQGILISHVLIKLTPNWLIHHEDVFQCLLEAWKIIGKDSSEEEFLSNKPSNNEMVILAKSILTYCKDRPEDPNPIFDLLSIFGKRLTNDFTFLHDFYDDYIPNKFSTENKKRIINRFLEIFPKENIYSSDHKVQILRALITPLIIHSCDNNEDILDPNAIPTILNFLISSGDPKYQMTIPLLLELIQLASLLVKYRPNFISKPIRDSLIKFFWQRLKNDDPTIKQAAHIFISRFIGTYESPENIVIIVYTNLIQSHQAETKHLVREALDILIPTLGSMKTQPNEIPKWIACTKKVFVDEGYSPSQLIHILHLLVRHSNYFYPYRSLFVYHMVNSLRHVPNVPAENRKLAVSIVELIIQWEKKRVERGNNPEEDQSESKNDFILPQSTTELIKSFLIRISTNLPSADSKDKMSIHLSKRALVLLEDAFIVWPNANVKTSLFERLIQSYPEEVSVHKSMLKILCVIVKHKIKVIDQTDEIKRIEKVVLHVIKTKNKDVATPLCQLIKQLNAHYSSNETRIRDFIGLMIQKLEECLNDGRADLELEPTIMVINSIAEDQPNYLSLFENTLLKVLDILEKNHNKRIDPNDLNSSNKINSELLLSTIKNIGKLLTTLDQPKKSAFFENLYSFITNSLDEPFLVQFVETIHEWFKDENISTVFTREETFIFIEKMRRFEKVRSLPLHRQFLDFVYFIYTNESSKGNDISPLEPVFMIGLCSKDPTIHSKYFEIFNSRIEGSIFKRLETILNNDTWKALPHLFWIQQSVELLFCQVLQDASLELDKSTPRFSFFQFADSNKAEFSDEVKELLKGHMTFLNDLNNIKASHLLNPLRELIYHDSELASQQWGILFSSIWNKFMSPEEQKTIQSSAETLMKQQEVSKQRQYPTTVQSLTKAFRLCKNPPIEIPTTLAKFTGRYFNSWHVSIRILEDRLYEAQTPIEKFETMRNLSDLYRYLCEEDYYYGIIPETMCILDTKQALIYEKYGKWDAAQVAYYRAMDDHSRGIIKNVPVEEQEFWEKRWIECTKKLNQWEILADYAKNNDDGQLLYEACWKIGDWAEMKHAFTKYNIDLNQPKMRILQCFSLLQEGNIKDVDDNCKLAMTSLVTQWNSLPKIPSPSFTPYLQAFQQIIELYESAKIVKDLNAGFGRNPKPDMKNTILKQWRERLPNDFDDISIWYDLIQWRQHVFSIINSAINQERGTDQRDPSLGFAQYEMGWSINKLAHIARKQGLYDVGLKLLDKIYHIPNIEVQDAFIKLKEQVKCYSEIPASFRVGLEVINSTNLDYFNAELKSEFYLLKGKFLSNVGNYEESGKNFSTAITIYDNNARAWIEWGKYFDILFEYALFQNQKNQLNHAKHALMCYLQALKCSTFPFARDQIARIFWLLSFDNIENKGGSAPATPMYISTDILSPKSTSAQQGDEKEVEMEEDSSKKREAPTSDIPSGTRKMFKISDSNDDTIHSFILTEGTDESKKVIIKHPLESTFLEHSKDVPVWIWLVWLEDILNGLGRSTMNIMHQLLMRISSFYPNALFYELNRFIKENASQKVEIESDNSNASSEKTPLKLAEDVLSNLTAKFPLLTSSLDKLVNDLSNVLKPSLQESILDILHNILEVALSNNDDTDKKESLLNMILNAFYDQYLSLIETNNSFIKEFKNVFEFKFRTSEDKNSIAHIIDTLEEWIKLFSENCSLIPDYIEMDKSLWISQFQNDSYIEIPGQHLEDKEVSTGSHIVIDKVYTKIKVIKSIGAPKRMITMKGSNGKMYYFLGESMKHFPFSIKESYASEKILPASLTWKRESQFLHTFKVVNKFLKKNVQSRKRCVQLYVPSVIPIGDHCRLLSSDDYIISMQDIYDEWCIKNQVDPFLLYRMSNKKYLETNISDNDLINIYESCTDKVPNTILTNYLSNEFVDPYDHFWHFRKYFTVQLGVTSLMSYLFSILPSKPSQLFILINNSQLYTHHYYPSIDSSGTLNELEIVPFRLTQNLQRFIGYDYESGIFESSITSSLIALKGKKELDLLRRHLYINFRESIIELSKYDTSLLDADTIYNLILLNTDKIFQRIDEISPNTKPNYFEPKIKLMNEKTVKLIRKAADRRNIMKLDTAYCSWM